MKLQIFWRGGNTEVQNCFFSLLSDSVLYPLWLNADFI